MSELAKAVSTPEQKKVLATLTGGASFEITAREPEKAVASLESLEKTVPVYVAHIPGDPWIRIVETATLVKQAGFTPIPHVVSRNIKDEADLDEFLKTLVGELGIEKILCLGGDVDNPPGKFTKARDLVETGLFPKNGIKRIGLAAHPEEHPKAPVAVFERELQLKFQGAKEQGLDPWIVTQFSFEAAPILARLKSLREQGVDGWVRIGVAGPAGLKSMINFAIKCGVGNSVKGLLSRPTSIGKLIVKHTPDELMADLVPALAADPLAKVEGLHFFTFGGVPAAQNWRKEAAALAA